MTFESRIKQILILPVPFGTSFFGSTLPNIYMLFEEGQIPQYPLDLHSYLQIQLGPTGGPTDIPRVRALIRELEDAGHLIEESPGHFVWWTALPQETQETVVAWVRATFGEPQPRRSIERALEEVVELEELLPKDYTVDEVGEEMADVVICLMAAAEANGVDLRDAINAKMRKNRARRWESRGDGTGYHIKD